MTKVPTVHDQQLRSNFDADERILVTSSTTKYHNVKHEREVVFDDNTKIGTERWKDLKHKINFDKPDKDFMVSPQLFDVNKHELL